MVNGTRTVYTCLFKTNITVFFYFEFFGLFSRHYLLKWLQLHFLRNVAKVVLNSSGSSSSSSSSKKIENIFAESKSPVDSVYKNKGWVIEMCWEELNHRPCTTWLSWPSCVYRAPLFVEYKWSSFWSKFFLHLSCLLFCCNQNTFCWKYNPC